MLVHELSITENIIAMVSEKAGDQKVIRVKLQIGLLSAIEPDAIRFCFQVCTEGTSLQDTVLEIDEVPGWGRCKLCGEEMPLALLARSCVCGSLDIICVAGQELNVVEMEVL